MTTVVLDDFPACPECGARDAWARCESDECGAVWCGACGFVAPGAAPPGVTVQVLDGLRLRRRELVADSFEAAAHWCDALWRR